MAEIQKTVFISYRRSASWACARLISKDLRDNGFDVFMDVENLNAGEFKKLILNQIAARAHFIVVLAPGTVERFKESNDMLRQEIEYAITLGRNIIPVTHDEFTFKDYEKHFTGDLRQLLNYGALTLLHEFFDEGLVRLRERYLQQPYQGRIDPTPIEEETAVEEVNDAVERQPAPTKHELDAEIYFNRAFDKAENGDFDGAITDYTEAIRLNPEYSYAYMRRGHAYSDQGELGNAISDYTQAIYLDPQNEGAYIIRGLAYKAHGKHQNAIDDFTHAIRLNPQLAEAYIVRGNAYFKEGTEDDAISDYSHAIRLDPQDTSAYILRGLCYESLGEHVDAISDYTLAIHVDPQLAEAYIYRGNTYEAQRKFNDAIDDYTCAIELNPQDGNAYITRGLVYVRQGKLDKAVDDYTCAIQIDPQNAQAYYNRGYVYGKQGKLSDAVSDYQKYLDVGGGKQYDDQAEVEGLIQELKVRFAL